ncbi:MAG: methyltransferase family protein [Chromatiales bacterium]
MNETPPRQDNAGVVAPPPLIYLAAVLAGYGLSWVLPALPWLSSLPRSLGASIVILGVVLLAWGFIALSRAGTAVNPYQPTTALVTQGPYRYSRNPLYVALTLLHAGFALWLHDAWILLTVIPAVLVVHYGVVLREERYLLQKFGEAYRSYQSQARRWL